MDIIELYARLLRASWRENSLIRPANMADGLKTHRTNFNKDCSSEGSPPTMNCATGDGQEDPGEEGRAGAK